MRTKVTTLLVAVLGIGIVALRGDKPEPAKKAAAVEKTTVASTDKPCVPHEYTVKLGDNLSRIAGREYGYQGMFPLIFAANRDKIKDPNVIMPGWVLTIPCCIDKIPQIKFAPRKRTVTRRAIAAPKPAIAERSETVVQQTQPAPPVTVNNTNTVTVSITQPAVQQQQQQQQQQVVPPPPPAPVEQPKPFTPPPPPAPPKETVLLDPPNLYAPGSTWNSFMTSPLERGNYIDYFHFDQGVVIGRLPGKLAVEPYVAINATRDTKGMPWNNRVQGEAGLKLVRPFSKGVIEFGGAWAIERRNASAATPVQTRSGIIGFTNGWFGWQQPSRRPASRTFFNAAPGTFQWTVGNISVVERNNLIGTARLEQGVTLAKVKGVSLIPLVGVQATVDRDRNPWNNRWMGEAGMKVAVPWKTGTLDFKAGYQCWNQYRGGPTSFGSAACGIGAGVNIWTGWRKLLGGL